MAWPQCLKIKQLETYQTALAISLILVGQKFSIMSTHRANDGLEVSLKQRKNQSSSSPAWIRSLLCSWDLSTRLSSFDSEGNVDHE